MNLQEQIGALETGVDQLIQIALAPTAAIAPETAAGPGAEVAAPEAPASAMRPLEADAAARQETAAQHAAGAAADGIDAVATGVAIVAATNVATNTATGIATAGDTAVAPEVTAEVATADAAAEALTLLVGRPAQNEITMTIAGKTVSLGAQQIGQLIEELANARASMTPEPPASIPPGWRFAATRNPMMAVQKHANGDRLLVMRHTGHGWVPFTFSPDMVIQMYMLLTQR